MSHRAKWIGAVVVAVVVAAAVWLWPRKIKQSEAPLDGGAAGSATGGGGGGSARRAAQGAAGGRSPEEIERARQKRADLAQKINAAQNAVGTSGASGTAAGGVPGTRVLDKDYIRGRIKEILPLVEECYEMGLRTDPRLSGRLVVSFDIAGEPELGGMVERAEIVNKGGGDGGDITNPTLRECLQATIESITFAPPEGGGRVSVTYPFVFTTGQ
jgi:hypothetical protein